MPATPLFSMSVMFVLVSVFATMATLHFMVMFDWAVAWFISPHFAHCPERRPPAPPWAPMSGSGTAISPVLSLLMWTLQCAGSTSLAPCCSYRSSRRRRVAMSRVLRRRSSFRRIVCQSLLASSFVWRPSVSLYVDAVDRPRLRMMRVVPCRFKWRPYFRRYPPLGCPSARRNDLSLEMNFAPTLADMSWSTVLSSSTRCWRSTQPVRGGMLLITTLSAHATLSVATCSKSLK